MKPGEEIRLYDSWCAGDRAAGAELIDAYFPNVYRFFANKCREELEDLVQQTFMRLVEKRESFRREATFRAFLLGVARLVLLEHCRRRARERNRSVDFGVSSIHALDESPSQVVARERQSQLILEALRQIPIDLQVILELYYWEGLGTEELALTLHIPRGTVKSRLHRARQSLRNVLEALGADPQLDIDVTATELRDVVTPLS